MSELAHIATLTGLIATGCLPAIPAGLRTPLFIAQSSVPGVGKPLGSITTSWIRGAPFLSVSSAYSVVVTYMCATIILAVLVGALHEKLRVDHSSTKKTDASSSTNTTSSSTGEQTKTYTVLMTMCAIVAGIFLTLPSSSSASDNTADDKLMSKRRVGSFFADIAILLPMGYIGVAIGRYLASASHVDEDTDAKRKKRAVGAIKQQAVTAVMATSSLLLTMLIASPQQSK